MSFWVFVSGGIAAIIIGIAILLVWIFMKEKRSGYPLKDERTQKITGKAAISALLIGMYSTLARLFVNLMNEVFYDLPAFEVGYGLIASLLIYSISFIGFFWFFSRKGD